MCTGRSVSVWAEGHQADGLFFSVGRWAVGDHVGVSRNVQGQRRLRPREESLLTRSSISPHAHVCLPVNNPSQCLSAALRPSLPSQSADGLNNVNTQLPLVTARDWK